MGNICPRRCVAQLGSRLGVFSTHRFHQLLLLLLQLFYCTLHEPLPPAGASRGGQRGVVPPCGAHVPCGCHTRQWVRERHRSDLAALTAVTARVTHRAKLLRLPVESKREVRALPSSCFCRVLEQENTTGDKTTEI